MQNIPNELLLKIITYIPDRDKDLKNKLSLKYLFILARASKSLCEIVKKYCVYLVYNYRINIYINDIYLILKIIHFIDKNIVLLNDIGSVGFKSNRLIQFDFNSLKEYMISHINKMCYDDDDIIVSYGWYQEASSKGIFYFGWGIRFIFEPEDEEIYEKMYISGMNKNELLELENIFMKRTDFTKVTVVR